MKMIRSVGVKVAIVAATVLSGTAARAQTTPAVANPSAAPPEASPQTSAPPSTPPPTAPVAAPPLAPLPPAPPPGPAQPMAPKAEDAPAEMTDHDRVVGRVGITMFELGTMGTSLPIAPASAAPATPNTVSTPAVGIRYWFQRDMGFDFGVGINWTSTSTTTKNATTTNSTDVPSPLGLAFHAGLPIALYHAKHYSFLVIPEASVGFTSETVKGTGTAQDQDLSAWGLQIGARAGAEVHFGFIGLPQLALEGTLGLELQYGEVHWSSGNSSWGTGQWLLQTTVGPHPWSVFTDNIAATYYF